MSDEEILASTRIWLEKAVIGLNLCPFAKAVVTKKQVRYVVCMDSEPEQVLKILQAEMQHLVDTDAAELDTTLLIAPPSTPADTDALLRSETLRWAKFARDAKIEAQ